MINPQSLIKQITVYLSSIIHRDFDIDIDIVKMVGPLDVQRQWYGSIIVREETLQ